MQTVLDPLRDIAILQGHARLSVMQGGRWATRNFTAQSFTAQSFTAKEA